MGTRTLVVTQECAWLATALDFPSTHALHYFRKHGSSNYAKLELTENPERWQATYASG